MVLTGAYDFSNMKHVFYDDDCKLFDFGKYNLHILCNSSPKNIENISREYMQQGIDCVNSINVPFLIVATIGKKLQIFADATNSLWTLYYTLHDDRFYYSTSLKRLLMVSGIKREMDFYSARSFLHKGFLSTRRTLVKNVFKLSFCDELTIIDNELNIKKYNFIIQNNNINKGDAIKKVFEIIDDNINQYLININQNSSIVSIPLSSGYDTNYILKRVYNNSREICAFTIGGAKGTNEIPAVKENLKNFPLVKNYSEIVDEKMLNFYPDIVWRLEGLLYERGIFLQYALAKKAKSVGVKNLICGEGADQQLHKYYQDDVYNAISGEYKENLIFRGNETPYLFGSCVILKKSYNILSSFGIEPYYPFMDKRISEMAYSIRNYNGVHKNLYRREIETLFSNYSGYILKKVGGSTDSAAVIPYNKLSIIQSILNSSEIVKKMREISYSVQTSIYHELVHREYINENEDMFWSLLNALRSCIKRKFYQITMGYMPSSEDEPLYSVDRELKELFLVIFYTILLSGKYDSYFDCDSFPFELADILGDVYVQ